MSKKEKLLEIVKKLSDAIEKTNSSFKGHVKFGILENGKHVVDLTHFDDRYELDANFIMIFEHYTEEQMNNDLLLALDVINYNRLIREEKSI